MRIGNYYQFLFSVFKSCFCKRGKLGLYSKNPAVRNRQQSEISAEAFWIVLGVAVLCGSMHSVKRTGCVVRAKGAVKS